MKEIDKLFDNSLSQKLYDDLTRFSIPPLLRYEDRNSMAFSLEARVPFLDHRVVEYCFALHDSKARSGQPFLGKPNPVS